MLVAVFSISDFLFCQSSSTSADLFIMFGSDFDRPGLLPQANYNIGIGHTCGFLKKDLIGDELTFGPDNRSLFSFIRAITELLSQRVVLNATAILIPASA